MKLKPSLLLNPSQHICPLTFITEVLHLVATTKYFIRLLWLVRRLLWHLFLTCYVTKAIPFQFIDGNILKSCRTDLTNYTWPISYHITRLVRQTHRQTDRHTYQCANKNDFKKLGVRGWRSCAWFKNSKTENGIYVVSTLACFFVY